MTTMFDLPLSGVEESLQQIEERATLQMQMERCQRLGTLRELEGDRAQAAAYELAATKIQEALDALQCAHGAGETCEC